MLNVDVILDVVVLLYTDGSRRHERRRSVRRWHRRVQSRLSRGHQRPGRRSGNVTQCNGVRWMRRARTRADRPVRGRTYVALQVPEVLRLCQAVARSALLLPERHAALLQARLCPVSRLSIDTFAWNNITRIIFFFFYCMTVTSEFDISLIYVLMEEEKEMEREKERERKNSCFFLLALLRMNKWDIFVARDAHR